MLLIISKMTHMCFPSRQIPCEPLALRWTIRQLACGTAPHAGSSACPRRTARHAHATERDVCLSIVCIVRACVCLQLWVRACVVVVVVVVGSTHWENETKRKVFLVFHGVPSQTTALFHASAYAHMYVLHISKHERHTRHATDLRLPKPQRQAIPGIVLGPRSVNRDWQLKQERSKNFIFKRKLQWTVHTTCSARLFRLTLFTINFHRDTNVMNTIKKRHMAKKMQCSFPVRTRIVE